MGNFILSCCSTVDLSEEQLKERDIKYVCFHFTLDGKDYPDNLGKSISFADFYKKMEEGAMTKTSQVNVEEYIDYFEPFLKDGKDILHLTLSSGISGTINSANIARDELAAKYPERKIYVVDSLAASAGFGLLMDKLADLRDEGKDIDYIYNWAEEHKLELNHWFFTTDLTYLVRGGRVSKVSGFVGNMLNICPLLNVDLNGKLIARQKIRTKKKVISTTVDKMEELAKDGLNYADKVFISNSACYDDARAVADLIEARFPKMKGKVVINSIGTTIGSHTGPGTVALFFWGKKRED
ncbi:MAG: DegV family protein [Lachnospiraceae bacterium]|nr:DegV family protein [Lachnospiraceae bacterium]